MSNFLLLIIKLLRKVQCLILIIKSVTRINQCIDLINVKQVIELNYFMLIFAS